MRSIHDLQMSESHPQDLDFITIKNKEKLIQALKRLGAAYIGELAFEIGVSEYELKGLLNKLNDEGVVERIPVEWNFVDVRLLRRVPEMSNRGQGGFDAFSRKHWYGLKQ